MFKVFLVSILVVAASASVSMHDPFYCFATDPIRPQNQMFSIITSYENNRGAEIPRLSTCTPRRFWMLGRGGTRLPSINDAQNMVALNHDFIQSTVLQNYNLGRTQLCRADMQNIANWVFNETLIDDTQYPGLTETGWQEWLGIGQRFQQAFPEVLPPVYQTNRFLFRHTSSERTTLSLHAFTDGLFGENAHRNVSFALIPNPDIKLRPHDNCPLLSEARGNTVEMDAFEQGPEFQEMIQQVNRKLGFLGVNMLPSRDIRTLWYFCRFYQGVDPLSPSPWCAAFSVANNAVLEYFMDLDIFYNAGYGGPERLFANINCHLMQDLLSFLTTTTTTQTTRVFISHSTALQLFLTTLGAFRDETPLTRHNFAQQTFRQWRSSRIASMATNFAFIQHQCDDGELELVILQNERPLIIPGCEGPGFCRQTTFLQIFERFVGANCAQLFCSMD